MTLMVRRGGLGVNRAGSADAPRYVDPLQSKVDGIQALATTRAASITGYCCRTERLRDQDTITLEFGDGRSIRAIGSSSRCRCESSAATL